MHSFNSLFNVINIGFDQHHILSKGYKFIKGKNMPIPASVAKHWADFAISWSNLPNDEYMPDGASYRKRRFCRFIYDVETGNIELSADNIFFQKTGINQYAGGINRAFPPIQISKNKFLLYIIENSLDDFVKEYKVYSKKWDIKVHQFRIITANNTAGLPTPEGIHQDGHKFVSMHLIARKNISGGVSEIYNLDKKKMMAVTLENPMDSLLLDDEMFFHYVTPICAADNKTLGYRDMLVIDYNLIKEH